MANYQCKKLDPLVVGDIGDYCIDCLQSTAFGTGKFVNRLPGDRHVYDGAKYIGNRSVWLLADCNWLECDRCDEKIYCDEDCTPYDVYQDHEPAEFSDGAYRVHYECLTDKEKEIMEANNQ